MISLGRADQRPRLDHAVVDQLRAWTRAASGAADEAHILVTELRCAEPGCPPVETVFAIMAGGGATRQYKVFRPAAEVTADDVRRALSGPPAAGPEHAPLAGGHV